MSSLNDPHVIETYRMKADSIVTDLDHLLHSLRCIDNAVGLDWKHRSRLQLLSNALTDLAADHTRGAAE